MNINHAKELVNIVMGLTSVLKDGINISGEVNNAVNARILELTKALKFSKKDLEAYLNKD